MSPAGSIAPPPTNSYSIAEANGLLAQFGADEIRRIVADAFGNARSCLTSSRIGTMAMESRLASRPARSRSGR
jgi:hypothetical protein